MVKDQRLGFVLCWLVVVGWFCLWWFEFGWCCYLVLHLCLVVVGWGFVELFEVVLVNHTFHVMVKCNYFVECFILVSCLNLVISFLNRERKSIDDGAAEEIFTRARE